VVRARLTIDDGYFPAFWTTGPGEWPYGGEVDLMEYYKGRVLANFAWGNGTRWGARRNVFNNPNHGDKTPWKKKFHVWKLVGSDTKTQILLDDELMNEVSHDTARDPQTEWSKVVHPFKQGHSLILNLAIGGPGGDPPKATWPLVYEVDYARVYQKE